MVQEVEEGEQLLRRSLAIWRELDDRTGLASGLNQLGTALVLLGTFDESQAMFEENLAICRDLGLRFGMAWAETWLGFAELHQGHYARAGAQAQTALALGREIDDQPTIGRSLWLLGDVALARGSDPEAQRFLEESVAVYQAYGLPDELVMVLADLGVTALVQHQLDQAQQHLCQALQTAAATRMIFVDGQPLATTALLLAELGHAEEAAEVYALACRYRLVTASRWFDDVIGRRMTALTAGLPPEAVAAAQARGQAHDLHAAVAELATALAQRPAYL